MASTEGKNSRAYWSMFGKGIIGLFSCIIFFFISMFRNCDNSERTARINTDEFEIESDFLRPISLKNDTMLHVFDTFFNVDENADSLLFLIKEKIKDGFFVKKIDINYLDTVNRIKIKSNQGRYFKIEDLKGGYFILIVENKKITNVVFL